MIVLAEPLEVLDAAPVSLIELIPRVHQRVYRMGLEQLGVVVGEDVDAFSREHRAALTGQQFQSVENEPYYVLFEDFTIRLPPPSPWAAGQAGTRASCCAPAGGSSPSTGSRPRSKRSGRPLRMSCTPASRPASPIWPMSKSRAATS